MQQDIQMKTNEIQREGRKKDKLERELRQAKVDVDAKVADMKNLQATLDNSSANVARLNGELREQKVSRCMAVFQNTILRFFSDFKKHDF